MRRVGKLLPHLRGEDFLQITDLEAAMAGDHIEQEVGLYKTRSRRRSR